MAFVAPLVALRLFARGSTLALDVCEGLTSVVVVAPPVARLLRPTSTSSDRTSTTVPLGTGANKEGAGAVTIDPRLVAIGAERTARYDQPERIPATRAGA